MADAGPETLTTFERYERERQRRILSVLAPAGTILTGITAFVAVIALAIGIFNQNNKQSATTSINILVTLMLCGAFFMAWRWLQRDQLQLATLTTGGAASLGILATVIVAAWGGITSLSLIQIVSLSTITVLIGMLAGIREIVAAAIIVTITTISLLIKPYIGDSAALATSTVPLMIVVASTYQWAVAACMIALSRNNQLTLQSLALAYEQAKQLDDLKDQFITHVNHELRTPIMTVHSTVAFLHEALPTLPQPVTMQTLERATRSSQRLLTLLSSLLEVRRIDETAPVARDPINVRSVFDAALSLIEPQGGQAAEREIFVAIAPTLMVLGDTMRLQQILTNLLSNAVKYSPANAPIEVTAQSFQSRDGQSDLVRIAVRDHGPGIAPREAALLFNRFARLPRDLASNVPGTGLGLYLCRVYAQSMGGTIWIESSGRPGEGSTFVVQLPAVPQVLPTPVGQA